MSKFKPAIAGPSGSASSSAATRRTNPSSAFSTSAATKKPLSRSHDLQMSPSPPAPLPIKRLNSDAAERPPLKRFKPAAPPAIDLIQKSPVKRHDKEVLSEVDFLISSFVRTKSPDDLFKSSRKIPLPSRSLSPQKCPVDFSDLNAKSTDDLASLLSSNESIRTTIAQMMSDHIHKIQCHDIIVLSLFLSQIDDRIRAIQQRIASLEIVQPFEHPSPVPFPLSLDSVGKQRDTRRSPTPSMTVSDSSNTTVDTMVASNVPLNLTENIPLIVDSPDFVDADLQDISTITLVPDGSDDAYDDKFDPIPEDLVFLDKEKLEQPEQSHSSYTTTASASVSSSFFDPAPAASIIPDGRIDHTSSPYYKEVISILKNTFKLSTFRTNQLECIVATLDAKDVFYLAPTGGGKSLCFQLPALCVTGRTQGTTFVISPLISLITDQVASLRKRGIAAFPLTSAAEDNEVRQAMRMMRSNAEDKPKLVYTTPERLQKSDSLKDVVNQLYEEKQLARFVVDEAHVIGSWGRDFRVSYAELGVFRKNWPNVPIMALTGSANKDAIEDITVKLAMRNPVYLAQSFNRPNLHYSVREKPSVRKELVQHIAGFIKTNHPHDTGIVYVLSRKEAEDMAKDLNDEFGIEARHYHAKVDNEERKIKQDDWMAGRYKVIVATIAFGMGIDKPDVRFVIHATLSKDMDGYYQETGRAGRDGKASDCVLFYRYGDATKIENMLKNPNNNDPTRDHKPSDVEIERQIAKLQGVVSYCTNESDCRRVLILRHFDEEFKPENCHNQCDNCYRPGRLVEHNFTTEARRLLQLLQEMTTINSRGVTANQLKDTWKGRNNKNVQQYKALALYASGKTLSHTSADRIFTHLANEGVISTFRLPSGNGFSNNYIQLGAGAQEYLAGGKELVLSWKEREEDAKAPTKRAPAQSSSSSRKKEKEPVFSLASDFRSLYEDIEDADETFVVEVPREAIEQSEPTTSRIPSRPSGSQVERAVGTCYEDEVTARLGRLQETRHLLGDKWSRYPLETILQDHTLEMLAYTAPDDAEGFKNILRDGEDASEVESKWQQFGRDFLAALKGPSKPFNVAKLSREFAFTG